MRASIVRAGEGAKSFLSSCVPDGHFDSAVVHVECFDFEIDADGRLHGLEYIVGGSHEDGGFSDAAVADHEDFKCFIELHFSSR